MLLKARSGLLLGSAYLDFENPYEVVGVILRQDVRSMADDLYLPALRDIIAGEYRPAFIIGNGNNLTMTPNWCLVTNFVMDELQSAVVSSQVFLSVLELWSVLCKAASSDDLSLFGKEFVFESEATPLPKSPEDAVAAFRLMGEHNALMDYPKNW